MRFTVVFTLYTQYPFVAKNTIFFILEHVCAEEFQLTLNILQPPGDSRICMVAGSQEVPQEPVTSIVTYSENLK